MEMHLRPHKRFHILDACRGMGACTVACFHFGLANEQVQFIPNGALAVDFFFVLSGFVIDRSYKSKLDNGMDILAFLRSRLMRLYPLYIVGQLIGLIRVLVAAAIHDPRAGQPLEIIFSAVFGFFMLPSPFSSKHLYMLNSPSWSILYELLINIVFALWLFGISKRNLVIIVLFAASVLAYYELSVGALGFYGTNWFYSLLGIPRVAFSFVAGMLISRLTLNNIPKNSNYSFIIVLALCAMFLLFETDPKTFAGELLSLASVFFIFPVIVTLGAICDSTNFRPFCAFLGDVSYPLYMTHFFLVAPTYAIGKKLNIPPVFLVSIYLFVAFAVATVFAYAFDAPVRQALSRRARIKESARPQIDVTI